MKSHNPLIIQSDRTLLLEVQNPLFEEVRDAISPFADLLKSPEYIHTYRITPLSLWNAASVGLTAEEIIATLERYAKYGLPEMIRKEIIDTVRRFGILQLVSRDGKLMLTTKDPLTLKEVWGYRSIRKLFPTPPDPDFHHIEVPLGMRGVVKVELIKLGYPVQDVAGYTEGAPLALSLRGVTRGGRPFSLRDYQQEAVEAFHSQGSTFGGSGVLVLPCGAGKTIIGLAIMEKVGMEALILTTNGTSVKQWMREVLDKTTLEEGQIGEYTGEKKQIRPVTVATYQILTYRPDKEEEEYPHLELFNQRNWGLIIYDEVHLLPAPVFRITADIQAKRRLGLTATLVREDGREEDVFSLIGSKKADVPWKELEKSGWIAEASCVEVRVPMSTALRENYVVAGTREKYRIAAENPVKFSALDRILEKHREDQVLVIGQYIRQLEEIAKRYKAPLITGKTTQMEREALYEAFRLGEIHLIIVSKVANFAIDLPDANVAIQVSGTFGSRQEEAQRLGRILRPKPQENKAYFYTLVTRNSKDQDFSMNRQLFLVEQGYRYEILEDLELLSSKDAHGIE